MSYPVFLELKDMRICFVGGGRIAYRKLKNLLGQDAYIEVMAPQICDEIMQLQETGTGVKCFVQTFDTQWLEGASLVFIVSDSEEANLQAMSYCRARGILFNNCMDSEKSQFKNGAVIRRGEIEVAIGSGGKRPGLSKWLKGLIDEMLPEELETAVKKYDCFRKEARELFACSKNRENYINSQFSEYLKQLEGKRDEN